MMKNFSVLRTIRLLAATSILAGCAAAIPPVTRPERAAVPVAATFAKTWDASVDVFADKNIGVRTIDRSSGLIVADPVSVPTRPRDPRTPLELADCGRNEFGYYEQPTNAIYNVRVRGDSARSTVLVTVRWTQASPSPSHQIVCISTGVWEREFEKLVKEKAEARSH
jgi:hypothetical protein